MLKKNKKIKFVWIPSHVGITGNDKADYLAKQALNNNNIYQNGLHCDELNPMFKDKAFKDMIEFIKYYDFGRGLKGRIFIENNKEFSFDCWFDNLKLERKRIIIINRIKCGHLRTRDHLYRKKILESDLCDCNSIQTLDHLIWECNLYDQFRAPLISFLRSRGIMRGQSITAIFNKRKINVILRIVAFILISKILI